jgi:hypothetical protein
MLMGQALNNAMRTDFEPMPAKEQIEGWLQSRDFELIPDIGSFHSASSRWRVKDYNLAARVEPDSDQWGAASLVNTIALAAAAAGQGYSAAVADRLAYVKDV